MKTKPMSVDQTIPAGEQKQAEYGPVNNPSYDKSLSPEQRLRDFMGAYHIVLHGVKAHEPFYLKNEGRPNERCDDDDKNSFVRFLNILVEDIRSSTLTEVEGEANDLYDGGLTEREGEVSGYSQAWIEGFREAKSQLLTRIKQIKEDHA